MSTTAANLPRGRLNVFLWISQILLAAFYGPVGFVKLTFPIPELAAMLHWPGIVPPWFVRFVGAAELCGAVGLILPAWMRILPRLSVLAAMALVLLQVCAIAFHINRSEFNVLPLNLVLLLVPIFIVWGRSRLPIVPR